MIRRFIRPLASLALAVWIVFAAPLAMAEKILDVTVIENDLGVTVWLVEDHSVPVISVALSFAGGLALEDPARTGSLELMSTLLDEGAEDLDAQAFQTLLNDNLISLRFQSGRDEFNGTLRTLTANRDLAFDLLAKALRAPRFDEGAVARMRAANLQSIRNKSQEPDFAVARIFNGYVFEGTPYARPGGGNIAGMNATTADDLHALAQKQFTRNNLRIVFAGDMTADDARRAVETIAAHLPAGEPYAGTPQMDMKYAGETLHYAFDIPQTKIQAGHAGPPLKSDDMPALTVLDYILGGGSFSSRLMDEIREKRGLTYGVSTNISQMHGAAVWTVSMSTKNESAAEAVALLKQQWQRAAAGDITAAEVDKAKAYLTGSLPLGFTSTSSIAGALNAMQADGYDSEYVNRLNDMISAVTLDDVNAAAKKWLKPDDLTFVIVGKPEPAVTSDVTVTTLPGM